MTREARADETRQIEHVREDLVREFAALPEDVIDQEVSALVRSFTRAPVRSFVPVLVRREARERLRQLA
jgi:hypothetical protein